MTTSATDCETVLRLDVPLGSRQPEKPSGLDMVLRAALASIMHHGEIVLRVDSC